MRKLRAALSLECALLLPVLLLLLVLALDMGILSYAKANAKSILKDGMYRAYEEAFQLKNSDFNSKVKKPSSLEDSVNNRLKRSLLDDFYLGIDPSAFEARMREELSKAFAIEEGSIVLNCDYTNLLGFSSIKLDYECEIKCLFQSFYKKAFPDFCKLRGQVSLELTKHFDAITAVDCIERMAKKNKKVSDFIEKSREMIEKLSAKIGN